MQTFYSAIQADNVPVIDDNLAQTASSTFRAHVRIATTAAQTGGAAGRAIQIVRMDAPAVRPDTARVRVVFADGGTDTVSLIREGLRWKVLTSDRLG